MLALFSAASATVCYKLPEWHFTILDWQFKEINDLVALSLDHHQAKPIKSKTAVAGEMRIDNYFTEFIPEQPLKGRARSESVVKTDSIEPRTPEQACSAKSDSLRELTRVTYVRRGQERQTT
eukprot:2170503-Pleurochrysis_carterae.AAC.1